MIPVKLNDSPALRVVGLSPEEKPKINELTPRNELDAAVWREFQQGSEQALATIFRSYADKLFNYGRQFTSCEDLVNDAIQDVFYQLIKSKDRIGAAHSVQFYLYSSFRRRLLRLLKQQRRLVCDENLEREGKFMVSIDPDYHSIQTMFTIDQKKLLEAACNALPERQREALSLYFFEGLSYKEIAQIMELSQVKSARKLLYRALDNLHDRLKKHKDIIAILLAFWG